MAKKVIMMGAKLWNMSVLLAKGFTVFGFLGVFNFVFEREGEKDGLDEH